MSTLLGEKIKNLRTQANISFDELAQKCSLTPKQLTSIEEDETCPSLSLLMRICRVLGVRVGTLLDGMEEETLSIIRKDDRPKAISLSQGIYSEQNTNNLQFFDLAKEKMNHAMEPFMIVVKKEESLNEPSSHEGEEFLYVVRGEIKLEYGDNVTTLSKGDTVYYDSIVPHRITSIQEESKILAVIYTPL